MVGKHINKIKHQPCVQLTMSRFGSKFLRYMPIAFGHNLHSKYFFYAKVSNKLGQVYLSQGMVSLWKVYRSVVCYRFTCNTITGSILSNFAKLITFNFLCSYLILAENILRNINWFHL